MLQDLLKKTLKWDSQERIAPLEVINRPSCLSKKKACSGTNPQKKKKKSQHFQVHCLMVEEGQSLPLCLPPIWPGSGPG